jgi:hypothetical protein
VRPGDAVLVKGSLGSRMALAVDAIQALDESEEEAGSGTAHPFRLVSGG